MGVHLHVDLAAKSPEITLLPVAEIGPILHSVSPLKPVLVLTMSRLEQF